MNEPPGLRLVAPSDDATNNEVFKAMTKRQEIEEHIRELNRQIFELQCELDNLPQDPNEKQVAYIAPKPDPRVKARYIRR